MAHPAPVRIAPAPVSGELDSAPILRGWLLELFGSPSYRPPLLLPKTALELFHLTRDPDASLGKMVSILEQDPVLAGEVLRLAQSAALAGAAAPRGLLEAISRMGLNRAAALFYRVAVESRVFRAPAFAEPMERLRLHSVATAAAARELAGSVGCDPGGAYLAGLLHDAGIAGALISLGETRDKRTALAFDHIWSILRELHPALTRRLLTLWQMPSDIAEALDSHDAPLASTSRLAQLIMLAEILAADLGFAFADEARSAELPELTDRLGLSVQDLEGVEQVLRAELR